MNNIDESDWKYLRSIKKTLLDRLSDRILDDIQAESKSEKRETDSYEQYLKVYDLVKKWDKVVGDCFDDWRRSKILTNILFLVHHQVITDEELEKFSEETRERIKFLRNFGG